MDRPNNPSETKYLLIGEEEFRNVFCAAIRSSARGFWLSNISAVTATVRCTCQPRACAKCSALRATSWTEHRLKRQIKAKVFQRQMMYSLYDLVLLAERLVRHKIRYRLSKAPRFDATGQRL